MCLPILPSPRRTPLSNSIQYECFRNLASQRPFQLESKSLAAKDCRPIFGHDGQYRSVQRGLQNLQPWVPLLRQRARYHFKADKNTQLIGNSLVRLCLECIKVWAYSSPEFEAMNPFQKVYDTLRNENINFPQTFVYFPKFKKEIKEEPISVEKK